MRHRSLGTTGVKVSPLCLGAMMFGAIGNPDHDDCIRIIHRALKGFGATKPVAPNTMPDGSDDPAGRQLNRRVEIIFARK